MNDRYWVNELLGLAGLLCSQGSENCYGTPNAFGSCPDFLVCDGDAEDSIVTELVLHGDGSAVKLNGELLGKLTNLVFLDLSNNAMTQFPTEIALLSNLETLELSGNSFDGPFPAEVLALSKLSFFSCDTCGFVGNWPDFSSVPRLVSLLISNNRLTGPIPSSFWTSVPDLAQLDVSGTALHFDPVPDNFEPSLTEILATDMSMTSFPTQLLSEFVVGLDLSNNLLSGDVRELQLNKCTDIAQLNIANNNVGGEWPSEWKLEELFHFNISHNRFSGAAPNVEFSNDLLVRVCDINQNCFSSCVNVVCCPSSRASSCAEAGTVSEFIDATQAPQSPESDVPQSPAPFSIEIAAMIVGGAVVLSIAVCLLCFFRWRRKTARGSQSPGQPQNLYTNGPPAKNSSNAYNSPPPEREYSLPGPPKIIYGGE